MRYYERFGLMPRRGAPPAATAATTGRPSTVAGSSGAQRLGLRLHDIKDLLAVRDTGECPCEPAEPLLRSRIAEIDVELERLGRLRADLVAMADQLPSATCPDPVPGTCAQLTTA